MKRERFLGRVNAALRGAVLPDIAGPDEAPQVRFVDPVGRFVDEATAVNADVVRVETIAEAIAAAQELGTSAGDSRVYIAWDDVATDFHQQMAEAGWERVDAAVGDESRAEDNRRVGEVKVGFTSVDLAIAATGSLVLSHGRGRPRSASLLVEHHVALLPVERIVHSLADAMRLVGWSATSNIVAITGPSRTGDIESILTLGVHGPGHLHIVLIG